MKLNSKILLQDLKNKTEKHIETCKDFLALSDEKLRFRKTESSWNILECIEHLKKYADYYYPLMETNIQKSNTHSKETFSTGSLGNYFANSMLVTKKTKKMKTPKDKNPLGENLTKESILIFIEQQKLLLQILETSEKIDIGKIKIPISIAPFVKIKLGDTLRFIVYHNERHIVQAQNILK